MNTSFTGTVAEKLEKSTYWQIKLDIGNNKVVSLNTKEKPLFDEIKIGIPDSTFHFTESTFTRKDKDGREIGDPITMKWITDGNKPVTDQPEPTNTPLEERVTKLEGQVNLLTTYLEGQRNQKDNVAPTDAVSKTTIEPTIPTEPIPENQEEEINIEDIPF